MSQHSPIYNELLIKKRLGQTKRDSERMDVIAQIRLNKPHLRILDTPAKRFELVMWIEAEKCQPLKGWLTAMTYNDPLFFQHYEFESDDTILRDSRELESLGFFEKP